MFVDLERENEAKLGITWDQKSILTSKAEISKNSEKNNGKSMILGVWWVEVGSKNRSKFDAKVEPKTGCISPSILADVWSTFGTKLGWKMD